MEYILKIPDAVNVAELQTHPRFYPIIVKILDI